MQNETKIDKKVNKQSTYAYKQTVKIDTGFYKGRWAKIIEHDGKDTYVVECMIDDRKHLIICKEEELRPQKTWFGK